MKLNKIYCGDALTLLKRTPGNFVDCVVTSPPYWVLRNYDVKNQLGLEPTFEEYIEKLCNIFDEVKRVLKPTGSCWIVIGDTYGSGTGEAGNLLGRDKNPNAKVWRTNPIKGFQKCLLGIPFRFAIEMINRGWILRNTIIWHKPNCMPSSASDRFTVDFEYVFFFVKNKKYYFEQQLEPFNAGPLSEALKVAGVSKSGSYFGTAKKKYKGTGAQNPSDSKRRIAKSMIERGGRNRRTVWNIKTTALRSKYFHVEHFATFPEALIKPMIEAGCPQQICSVCKEPQIKVFKPTGNFITCGGKGSRTADHIGLSSTSGIRSKKIKEKQFEGYSECGCSATFNQSVVLDPFMGAGTTALVAKKLNRNFLGFELNKDYVELANKRIRSQMEQQMLRVGK